MTLRAKLISAFATTLLVSILVFGYITYATFFNDRLDDKEEILRLRDESALLAVNGEIEHALSDLLLLQSLTAGDGNDLLKLVEISPWPTDATADADLTPFQRLVRKFGPATVYPTIVQRDGREYLLRSSGHGRNSRRLVVAAFVEGALRTLLERHCRFDRALLQVRLPGAVLYTFNRLEEHHLKQLSRASAFLDQQKPQLGHLLSGNDFYLYVPDQKILGLQLRYLVPKADLLQSAIAFKNRIITALVVLGWVSVWFVLILAYRITRPLGVLDQAARDIISYNYETPLELCGGSRELRSLAGSFETMRRKIKELVVHDSLTGLYNRRYLLHSLDLLVAKSGRDAEPLACLMIDVDHFKAINDRFGHQCGDEVLSELGRIMRTSSRSYDLAARYGGEEFTLVLPNTTLSTALQVAERLRQDIASHRFVFREQQITCTISLGIACLEDADDSPERLLDRADRALYAAKGLGRNRVVNL